MTWNFSEINQDVDKDIESVVDQKTLEDFRIKYLGRKGLVQKIFASLGTLSKEEKPIVGKDSNILKNRLSSLLEQKQKEIANKKSNAGKTKLDVSLPGVSFASGHTHLISQTIEEICDIFEKLGFIVEEGPEIETEHYNFSALNIPANHPSRDGFDTFYLNAPDPKEKGVNLLLRSHTSPGQIRIMEEHKPPLAVIIPGKVYRPDAVDASHSFMFHQIEGLLIDKDIKFSHLKGLLSAFCKRLFGDKIEMRFRPHFFPFTEPSAEVDISWAQGKKTWLEIMGCGLVHPAVFKAAGYPKGKYTGLAFGLGVERIAMLKYGIKDIRTFYENDDRFLKQF